MRGGFLPVIIAGITPILVFTLLVTGIGLRAVEWQPPILWSDQFGTQGSEVDNAVTAASADLSGVYAAGHVGLTLSMVMNLSPSNLFLSRYDPGGHQIWTRSFALPYDHVSGTSVGRGSVYIAGRMNGTGFVRKYDLNGTQLWTSVYGKANSAALSVSVGTSSVFSGFQYASGGSNQNNVLVAYDSNGNQIWTDSLGNSTQGSLNVYSDTNRLYVAGYLATGFLRSYYLNGTLEWTQNLSCSCEPSGVAADPSAIYVAGYSYALASGFLVKSNFNGSLLWTKSFEAPDLSVVGPVRMSVSPSGIYLVTTTTLGGYLIRYDTNGNQVWSVRVARLGSANAVSAGQNGAYVGGEVGPFSDAFLSEYDQSSSLILFGLNPPYSFILIAVLGGVVAVSVFWFRRLIRKRTPRPKSTASHRPASPSSDESPWVRRPP